MTTEDPQKIKVRLNEVAADVRDVYQDAVCCIRDLQRQVEVLREERDRLEGFLKKAAVWRIEAEMARVQSDAPDEQQEPEAEKPGYQEFYDRIGATDLLLRDPYKRNAGVATSIKLGEGSYRIVLPKSDQQGPERRGEVVQPEDLRCGDIADVWAGDKIIFDASEVKTVTAGNVWFRDQGYDGIPCTTRAGHEFRLVYRPTPAPVTAETIRASEPGSTWEDYEGAVFEWTGSALRWQMGEELGDCDYIGTVDYDLTRSTAAPRGDYGKKELPEVGDVIETLEQVTSLPDDTIIKPKRKLGIHGFAQQKIHGNCWMEIGDEREVDDRTIAAHYLPATVLHLPDSDPATAHERTDQK